MIGCAPNRGPLSIDGKAYPVKVSRIEQLGILASDLRDTTLAWGRVESLATWYSIYFKQSK